MVADSLEHRAELDGAAPIIHLPRNREPLRVPVVRFVPASDLIATPQPINWLVRKIVVEGSMMLLIGAPASFKSSVALDIAASIATGAAWHGRPTNPGAVFFLAGEGNHGIARRLKAWTIYRDANLATAPLFVSTGSVGLIDPLNAAAVAEEVQRLIDQTGHVPRLVVIDTLARNFGPGDENSASDMGKFVSNLDLHLREGFKCAVLVVHHSGVMDASRARGSSALRAAVDTEIICDRVDRTVTLRCAKMKDAQEFEPLAFEARVVELPWNGDDGEPETSFVMAAVDMDSLPFIPRASAGGSNQSKAIAVLERLVAENRERLQAAGRDPSKALVMIENWRSACDLPRNRWGEVINGLKAAGLVRLEPPHVVLNERPK